MGKKEGIMQSGISLKAIGIFVSVALAVVGLIIAATRLQGSQDAKQAGHAAKSYHDGAVPIEEAQWDKINTNTIGVAEQATAAGKLEVMQRVLVEDVAEIKSDIKEGFKQISDAIKNK
jgi:hypothetical protein